MSTAHNIYTPQDDAPIDVSGMCADLVPQRVSRSPGFPPMYSTKWLQHPPHIDMDTGIFIEMSTLCALHSPIPNAWEPAGMYLNQSGLPKKSFWKAAVRTAATALSLIPAIIKDIW
eukprot:926035-Amphidinium_carterae.1